MGDRLKGRVAVVTGSGQGIGKGIALAIAKEGAKVITNNRRPGSTGLSSYGKEFEKKLSPEELEHLRILSGDAETTAKEIIEMGGQAAPFFGDVSDFETAGKLIQTAVDKFGKIDILVNNAGTASRGFVWELSEEAWDLVTLTKVKGAFNCIRHASALMKAQQWGRIINCTSGAFLGTVEHCNYGAANAGIVGLTRSVARDLSKYGITCNAYAPTAMSRFHVNLLARIRLMAEAGTPIMTEERLQRFKAAHGPAEVMAPFIAYLATDEAAYINGMVFQAAGNGEIGLYSEPEVTKTVKKETGSWTVDELVESVPRVLLSEYKSPVT
ncbi:SDR family NAD(P)-dependent oxidoreductase [Chloroflexota bacterium]